MTAVYVVVPAGIHDPARPSGGNVYDRRICRALAEAGWTVHELETAGAWPRADAFAKSSLAAVVSGVPDGGLVLLDGLIASTVPDLLLRERDRLRLGVLVHMPLGTGPAENVRGQLSTAFSDVRREEHAALSAAAFVVTTSAWTREWLLDHYELAADQVQVAEPGVDSADLAPGTATGGELLCVATVTPGKGHDLLLAALSNLVDLPWRCVCAGSLERDPDFVEALTRQVRDAGMRDRVRFVGPLGPTDLGRAYARADALVLASRAETYGMVVTEALAHGVPVIATAVGGLPEALGATKNCRPGLLVPPEDAAAMSSALRRWLSDPGLRARLRHDAAERRRSLFGWEATTAHLSGVLAEAAGLEPAMAIGSDRVRSSAHGTHLPGTRFGPG